MNYDLFLCDFDGTLLARDGSVSQKNRDAIIKYRQMGGIFVIVTGRMLSSILPRARELGMDCGLIAAYQGALIAEIKTGKILRSVTFETEQAIRAVKYMESQDLHIHIYADDILYCNRDDEFLKIYEKICGVKGVVIDRPLSELIKDKNLRVVKALAMCDPKEREKLRLNLSDRLGNDFFVTCSSQELVEVLPAGADKASALKFLSRYYQIPPKKIAAMGDQLNDLPMISAAGGKFAVENADASLKHIATVFPSAEKSGVAEAILSCAIGENEYGI